MEHTFLIGMAEEEENRAGVCQRWNEDEASGTVQRSLWAKAEQQQFPFQWYQRALTKDRIDRAADVT